MKTTNIIYISILAFIIASCGAAEEEKVLKTELPLVVIEKAELKTFEHKISVQGNVKAEDDILLSSEMGGLITSISVKEGQRVSKGQTLANLDAAVLAANLYEMEAGLEQAKYMLSKQEELKSRGLGTDFELTSAKNQVKSIEARMRALKTQTSKSVIRAPFSGTIDKIHANQGEMTGPQSPILRLVNNSSVEIVANISEKHLAKIKLGTPIVVTLPNYNDTTINLIVTNVGNYIDPVNRTFRIMAAVNRNSLLLPNMLAQVEITDMIVPNAMVVPSTAVIRAANEEEFIYVAKKMSNGKFKAVRTVVKVVEKYDGQSYVIPQDALKDGDFVITEGSRNIADKDLVRTK